MPPFRIVARHPDRGHSDHAWAQVGGTFDSREDADAHIRTAAAEEPAARRALKPEDRLVHNPLVSFTSDDYDVRVQELVASKVEDRDGFPVEVEHKWKDVN
jgi:hypothetical protein